MKTIELLKPLPIRRDEQRHQYVNIETGQWFSYSTTGVCNELTEEAKENIEKYRFMWQPRGEKVHECLAEKMLGNKKIDMGDYENIIAPLLDHWLFVNFEPLAVEHMMSIPDKSVGGQLDLLGYEIDPITSKKTLRLIDLKTKSNTKSGFYKRENDKEGRLWVKEIDKYWKEPYSTDKQLGCYIEMLKLNYGIVPDVCNTLWAYPGFSILGHSQPVERCTEAWNEAWEKFEAREELF